MAIYEYKGLNHKGKAVKGSVDAVSAEAARDRLKAQGIYIQEITGLAHRRRRGSLSLKLFRKRSSTGSITRRLAFLLGASLPVVSALEGVIDQLEDDDVKNMMTDVKEKIKEGKSVSQAFSEYPDYFNEAYVSTLRAGEVSGKLDLVFERLANMYEKNQALIAKLRASLTYPSVMLLFALCVIVFLISFIVPTFAELFSDFEQTLPFPTRMLIGLSTVVSKGWWVFLGLLITLFYVGRRMYKKEKVRRYVDSMLLKLPVVKGVILDAFKIRFSYTMSLMLSNGVGILESLENTKNIFRNSLFREGISGSIEMIRKGETLSRALALNNVFHSSLVSMIHAGEVGDRVPDVLEKIASNSEIEFEEKVRLFTSLVEPVVILFIGLIVGFAVLSIVLPIFQINQMFG